MASSESSSHHSFWVQTAPLPETPALGDHTSAEVVIVGAGIAGLTTAYLLAREGKSVVVLDDGLPASGQTHNTTAHLSNEIDDRYTEMHRLHGERGAQLAAQSHSMAIERIEQNVRDETIDCDFRRVDGYLFLAPGQSMQVLDQELEAAHKAGLIDATRIERAPFSSFDTGPCLRFPRQAQFHPVKYLSGLVRAITRMGGRIFSQAHVKEVQGGKEAHAKTSDGLIASARQAIVVATNTPINDRLVMQSKQAPYTTYVVVFRIPKGSVPLGLYWDTEDPYHYVRLQPEDEYDALIVGGADHKSGQTKDFQEHFRELENWTRARFPFAQDILASWSGQVMETIDGLAYIGRNPDDEPNVYIVTGDSGMGMTHGTIAGMLLTDLIQGRNNPWASLYDPSRKTLRAAGDYARENLNVAKEYLAWIMPGDVDSVEEIPLEAGAILRRGLKLVAVYRDANGQLHEHSAVCPHLGCIVRWNPVEQQWDCPCHGSEFSPTGEVITGPATKGLEPVEND